MSSVRSGASRGRGRGSAQPAAVRGRAASPRGRGTMNNAQRGAPSNRSLFSQTPRSNTNRTARGTSRGNVQRLPSQSSASGAAKSRGSWQDRYQMLVKAREQERLEAIQRGLIADPDKPRSLSEAITPIGTCQEMCAEFERVQRVVQKDVWDEETDINHSPYSTIDRAPDEARMVKKFRRAAAGLEEQLPSDLRPPHVLKRTCDYLFDEVIGNAPSLAQVHHFVWDRTRAVRNDFSIQQVSKPEELRIAIDCYERIARFHILSLHQLALPDKPYSKYDWQQEREQLDRTLLSLMQYYDDSHDRNELPNEAEFRAYCVLFQLQDPTPDLEDRVQTWPRNIIDDQRVKTAVEVYMAACNVMDSQGPLKPRANHLIAQQDWQRFWELIESKRVSYLMGCVAEIYFNVVRRMVLNALFRAFRMKSSVATVDWTLNTLCELLAFDDGDEVYAYCERFGFNFEEREDGQTYLDLTSVKGRTLPEPSAGIPKQSKSGLVECKRNGRTIPAVISGLNVRQAYERGMIREDDEADQVEDSMHDQGLADGMSGVYGEAVESDGDDGESLFIPEKTQPLKSFAQTASPAVSGGSGAKPSPFSVASTTAPFGQPSAPNNPFSNSNPFQQKNQQQGAMGMFSKASPSSSGSAFAPSSKPSSTEERSSALQPINQFSAGNNGINQSAPTFSSANSGPQRDMLKDKQSESIIGNNTSTGNAEPEASGFSFDQPSAAQSIFASPSQSAQSTSTNAQSIFSKSNQLPLSSSTASQNILAQPSQSTQNAPFFSFSTPNQHGVSQAAPFTGENDKNTRQSSFSPFKSQAQSHTAAQTEADSSPFASPPEAAVYAPSSVTQLSDPKSVQPQISLAPTSTTSTPHAPSTASPSLGHSVKRPSFSTDTKPKKPSPLSNSITATEDSAATTNSEPAGNKQQLSTLPKSDEQSYKSTQQTAAEEHEAFISDLADEVLYNPLDGLLEDYVDFVVRKAFAASQDAMIAERNNQEAEEFRHFKLCEKYGHLWRAIFWRKRLAKTGLARRQRRLRRLRQRENQARDSNSLYDSQSLSSSRAGSLDISGETFSYHPKMGATNSAMAYPPTTTPTRQAAEGGSSSPTVIYTKPFQEFGHQQRKKKTRVDGTRPTSDSAPAIYDTVNQSKPRQAKSATEEWRNIEKRGSWNGYSLGVFANPDGLSTNGRYNLNNTPVKEATISSYFREKAAGLHAAEKLITPRGSKHNTNPDHSLEISALSLRSASKASASYDFNALRGSKRRSEELHSMQTPPPQRPFFKPIGVRQSEEQRGTKRPFSEPHSQETSPPALRPTVASSPRDRDEAVEGQLAKYRAVRDILAKETELLRAERLQFQQELRASQTVPGYAMSAPNSAKEHPILEPAPIAFSNEDEKPRSVPGPAQLDGRMNQLNGITSSRVSKPDMEIEQHTGRPASLSTGGLVEKVNSSTGYLFHGFSTTQTTPTYSTEARQGATYPYQNPHVNTTESPYEDDDKEESEMEFTYSEYTGFDVEHPYEAEKKPGAAQALHNGEEDERAEDEDVDGGEESKIGYMERSNAAYYGDQRSAHLAGLADATYLRDSEDEENAVGEDFYNQDDIIEDSGDQDSDDQDADDEDASNGDGEDDGSDIHYTNSGNAGYYHEATYDDSEDEEDTRDPYDEPQYDDMGHPYDGEEDSTYHDYRSNAHGNNQIFKNQLASVPHPFATSNQWTTANQGNSTLQAIGNTAEEAIELSD